MLIAYLWLEILDFLSLWFLRLCIELNISCPDKILSAVT